MRKECTEIRNSELLTARNCQRIIGLFICLNLAVVAARGTERNRLFTLQEMVSMALANSPYSKNVKNQRQNAYWRYRNFKTSFRPQLDLNGNIPDYYSTNTPVTQPDGSVIFRDVSLSKTSLNLKLNQEIALTGTEIFAATDYMRIDNLNANTVAYSGSPFMVGFNQTIFGYNSKKWTQKIEPLIWKESQKHYTEELEGISLNVSGLFFNLLRLQTEVELAESNLKNSKANLAIADVNIKLGKITPNDYKRVSLSVLNAKKALSRSKMGKRVAEFNLKSFIGYNERANLQLAAPMDIPEFNVDINVALEQARNNRREPESIKRKIVEAKQYLTQAKRSNGPRANLTGMYGLTNTSDKPSDLWEKPEVQKMIRLSLNIPILDWGRSASKVKMAESNSELVNYEVGQDLQQLEREVIVQAEEFNLLYEQIETAREADEVAEDGYQIALQQYQNGKLSITDLNIALQEREQSKRDFINSLNSFWRAYFNIRKLTLYDFENGRMIYEDAVNKENGMG